MFAMPFCHYLSSIHHFFSFKQQIGITLIYINTEGVFIHITCLISVTSRRYFRNILGQCIKKVENHITASAFE